ncbi:MAG: PDZ domain-containing protein [Calditrichaeota bacterium]|nr:MAG: PDZ domain-containing protein [Calditrichota bacterium]
MSYKINFGKISLLLFLGLIVFFYIITTTLSDIYYVITNPVAGFSPGYHQETEKIVVEKIVPNGPAARAGLRVGDIILQLNNQNLDQRKFQKSIFENIEVGDAVQMSILRQKTVHHIDFKVQRHLLVYTKTVLLQLLPGLVFCYALCLIGTFVFLQQIQQPTAHVFYLMLLAWSMAMMHFVFSLGNPNTLFPEWTNWLIRPSLPIAAGLMLHFYFIFPVPKTLFLKFRPPILFAAYSPAIILILSQVYMVIDTPLSSAKYYYVWMLSLIPVFVAAILALIHSIWRAPTPHARRQAQIVTIGTVVGLGIPACMFFFFRYFYLPIYLLTIIWPVSLAYAIVKHRFMNIDVIIRRGVAYAVMSGFVIAAYFILVVVIGQIFVILAGTESQFVTIVATLMIALAFNPVRQRVKIFIDKRIYPEKYNYRESVRKFSHQLVNVIDLQKLLNLLVEFLSTNIGISPIVLIWNNPHEKTFFIRDTVGLDIPYSKFLPGNGVVVSQLSQQKQLVDLSALKRKHSIVSREELEFWEALKAEIVLPLHSRKGLVGALALGPKNEKDPYYDEDIQLLETLSDQIQIAVENAFLTDDLREQERLRKELEVARKIQLSLLPQRDPEIDGLDISGISIPAMEVGGDYYDYLNFSDGRFGVVIGDVSGKGTSAALYMSQLKGMLKALARHNHSLSHITTELNLLTYNNLDSKAFITLMLASFDTNKGVMHLVRAGHLPLLHYSAKKGRTAIITPAGIGVGLDSGPIFLEEIEEVKIKFAAGDVFVFLTDGITEAMNGQEEEFDLNSIQTLLEDKAHASARICRDRIIHDVRKFSNNNAQMDDMTLVVVRIPE